MFKFIVSKMWNKSPDLEYLDVAEEIVKMSYQMDHGDLDIDGFVKRWEKTNYRPNLFNSRKELMSLSTDINSLIDLHYSCISHSDKYFAFRLREVVFQNGNGGT